VVDDQNGAGELYAIFLQANGYSVRIFTDRAASLSALVREKAKTSSPNDGLFWMFDADRRLYSAVPRGSSRAPILLTHGRNNQTRIFQSVVRPVHPEAIHTPEKLQQEVQAALAARWFAPALRRLARLRLFRGGLHEHPGAPSEIPTRRWWFSSRSASQFPELGHGTSFHQLFAPPLLALVPLRGRASMERIPALIVEGPNQTNHEFQPINLKR